MNARKQYRHPKWQRRRLEVFERDFWTCRACKDEETELQVHHLRYFPGEPWDTPIEWLLTLCRLCHKCLRHRRRTKRKVIVVDLCNAVKELL